MNPFIRNLIVFVLLAGGGYVAWSVYGVGYETKRFSVEATLRVDGREMTASQVWEVTYHHIGSWLPDVPGIKVSVRGEALAFPMSETEVVFLFRRGTKEPTTTGGGAWLGICMRNDPSEASAIADYQGGCFVDIDPTLAKAMGTGPEIVLLNVAPFPDRVRDPEASANAQRVEVLAIKVQATDAPITTGITSAYPWINELPRATKLISRDRVYREDFTTEGVRGL